MDRQTAEANEIIRVTVGSTVHGLALEGTDDRDEMGVCIEPIEHAIRLGEPFEQFIYRTAAEREAKHDAPSQPGDLDLTIYSLRKFCRLAAHGNPTILNLFFVKDHLKVDARGQQLQERVEWFVSKEAAGRYLGYLQAQRQRLLGERGQKRCNRPDLEEKYGYDTKYAMHMLRLGFQGVELMTTGRIQMPMEDLARDFLMKIRRGGVDINTVLTKTGELEQELKDLKTTSHLPEYPNRDAIDLWMRELYFYNWQASQQRYHTVDGNRLVKV